MKIRFGIWYRAPSAQGELMSSENKLKDITAPAPNNSLAEVINELASRDDNGLDRVRSVLALRMNQYSDIVLDRNEVKAIAKAFMDIETGSSTNLVMICNQKACLYRTRCALYASKKCPEGRECLHENKVLADAMDKYLESLKVDINNYPEMVMVNQLVEYELIEYRCNAILSFEHQNMKMESVIGIDENGQLITKEEISHALNIKLQVFKNKMTLLQELTATRREKYKKQAALKEAKEGPTQVISDIKERLDQLKRKQIEVSEVHDELNALQDKDME